MGTTKNTIEYNAFKAYFGNINYFIDKVHEFNRELYREKKWLLPLKINREGYIFYNISGAGEQPTDLSKLVLAQSILNYFYINKDNEGFVPVFFNVNYDLQLKLLMEEIEELEESKSDLVEVSDALVDILYVCFGTLCNMGLISNGHTYCYIPGVEYDCDHGLSTITNRKFKIEETFKEAYSQISREKENYTTPMCYFTNTKKFIRLINTLSNLETVLFGIILKTLYNFEVYFGFDKLKDVFDIIHENNMSKFKGGKKLNKDGKLIKGPNWVCPKTKIKKVLSL